jgi:cysteine desulfurase
MMKTIYLDNNATTKIAPEVLGEMLPVLMDDYGNPSSLHHLGEKAGKKLIVAREKIADLIGSSPEEIVFTSGGTESDNMAIWGTLKSNPGKKHIITTRVEHPAIKNLLEYFGQRGYRTTFVPVDQKGNLDLDYLYDHLTNDTAIVSTMWANNETGVTFPVREIASQLNKKGIMFHTDAVQAVGKVPVNVRETPIDMLSLSGHKLHAPKGVGVLYIKKGTKFSPFIIGGHQEKGRRGGTENTAAIVGLGKACEIAKIHLKEMDTTVRKLRDKLENGLLKQIPNTLLNGDKNDRLPNTLSISFEYIEGESILLLLNEYGVCASSGSACTSGSLEPSHVLRAMGVPFTAAHGSIRFSLSTYTTEEEIDFVILKLPSIVDRLRKMSPFWNKK